MALRLAARAGSRVSGLVVRPRRRGHRRFALGLGLLACSQLQGQTALAEEEAPVYHGLDNDEINNDETYFDADYGFVKIIAGTSNAQLSSEVANKLGVSLADCEVGRYADGEVRINLNEHVRGKDIYIIQSGQKPVNDHLIELLLLVSTAQRASAKRVTAVIPFFPYKHHRRSIAVNKRLHSRFLWSPAADFGKMLEIMGVDRVIVVDMERPGFSTESNFFSTDVPVETLLTTHLFAEYFGTQVFKKDHARPIVVVSPSTVLLKKAVSFRNVLQKHLPDTKVKVAGFVHSSSAHGPVDVTTNILDEPSSIKGSDVVICDELIDTGGSVAKLTKRLKALGAQDVYIYSSHGLFNDDAIEQIEKSPIKLVVVSNTVPLPPNCTSTKINSVSIGHRLAKLIYAEHVRSADIFKAEMEVEEMN
ncbi:unnamed protein product [Chrysoparadoxa australica]